jgi:hypothetical protein
VSEAVLLAAFFSSGVRVQFGPGRFGRMRRSPWRRWSWCRIQHWEAITSRAARESGPARDGDNVVLKDGRAAFQSVFHIHLHVVPRQNGDNKLSFAKGMLLRRDPDREKTGALCGRHWRRWTH